MENKNRLIIALFAVLFFTGLTFLPLYFMSLPIFILTLIAGFYLSKREKGDARHKLFAIFLIAYFARVILALIFYKFSLDRGLLGFFSGTDDLAYGTLALRLADTWRIASFPDLMYVRLEMSPSGTIGFYQYYLTGLMLISRNSTFLPIIINCSIGALSIFVLRSICSRLFDKDNELSQKAKFICITIFAFWPSLILWSTLNLKEAFTIFFFLFFILAITKILSKKSNPLRTTTNIFLMMIFLFVLSLLRENMFYIVGGALLLSMWAWGTAILPLGLKRFIVVFSAITIIALILIAVFSESQFIKRFVEIVNTHRDFRTIGGSAILPDFQFQNFTDILLFLPRAIIIGFFSPLPWQVTSFKSFAAVPEMLLWYVLFLFCIRGIMLSIKSRRRSVYFLLVFGMLYFLSLGFLEGNAGTLFRHRAIVLPIAFIFISAGFVSGNIFKRKGI